MGKKTSPQRIFCTKEVLSEVIRLRKDSPYSSVFAVIEKLSDIYLESEGKDEILEIALQNPHINKLLKRPHRDIVSQKDIISKIKDPRADDIFLLLPPISKPFIGIREKKGVLVTTSLTDMQIIDDLVYRNHRPYNLLTNAQKERFEKNGVEYEDLSSWSDIFDVVHMYPINAAIIIDNYIFHRESFDRRKQSLYPIIKLLVPQTLSIPFHLTIFVHNKSGELKKEKMEQVIKEIHQLGLKSEIRVSIIAHSQASTTHDRKILTNYHIITSGKGFAVIDNRGIRENAQGEINSTMHNINFLTSCTSLKNIHTQVIDWMKDIYLDKKGMESVYAFEVGDAFNNRLLMDE